MSDVYVRLGYEFNIACRAFNGIGVETQDLGPVPDLLRGILEETLSQEASQASLDKFLPRIRDIIINLLHGLKKKQQRLRQRSGKEGSVGATAGSSRQASVTSNASLESAGVPENVLDRSSSSRSFAGRQGSGDLRDQPDLPPRSSSVQGGRMSPRRDNFSPTSSVHRPRERENSRDTLNTDSSMSSNAMQNIPVIAPYPAEDQMPQHPPPANFEQTIPPPPPPPKQQDALAALQRGGELERRASRRFSAYQIQKHLGTPNGVPMIPPSQNSPIPNRGRDTQESMRAVRTRSTYLHSRQKSLHRGAAESSPLRNDAAARRISEEPSQLLDAPSSPTKAADNVDSPTVKTPEDKLGSYPFPIVEDRQDGSLGATVNGPIPEPVLQDGGAHTDTTPQRRKSAMPSRYSTRQPPKHNTPPQSQAEFEPETSPQPGKELTLFLQYKSKIKKFVLPDGGDLTIARLQLAFIEKFAWNTHANGNDLPEIYIQDPVSGVRHELEDLSDIKDRSVLVLNIEALDEVKRHFDDGLGGIRRLVEGIKTAVEEQQTALQRVSDTQQEAAKEMASLAAAPRPTIVSSTPHTRTLSSTQGGPTDAQLSEVQSLRRDLAVVRQTYSSFVSDINASMTAIRSKASSVKSTAEKTRIPSMDPKTGRGYVNTGKKTLSDDSEKLVTKVDDLQDTVEDLRKDVVTRGVRPLPRQLETVSKDISAATAALKKLQEFLKREKPVWTKIWEKELQVVCDDRDLLTMQEELCVDLEDDLEKAAGTFALVEQATRQQNLQDPKGAEGGGKIGAGGLRSASGRGLFVGGASDPVKAKDGVLGEVRALQPNHETRLEAIERAERARLRELESRRGGEFQKELGNFVEEGKLKKSGGVEEAERLRRLKDERNRKEVWERQQERARKAEERERAEKEGKTEDAAEAPQAENAGKDEMPEKDEGDAEETHNQTPPEQPDAPKPDDTAPAESEQTTPESNTDSDAQPDLPTPGSTLEVPMPGSFDGATEKSASADSSEGEKGTHSPSPDPEFVEAKEDPSTPTES